MRFAILLAALALGGCRYEIVDTHTTHSGYSVSRLDTITGEIKMCRVDGCYTVDIDNELPRRQP